MGSLTVAETDALREALDDEYRACATYDQGVRGFGEVPPFSHIREAEARHTEALCTLHARYGLAVPENPWPDKVTRYASLQEACAAGVAAENENGALYERLLASTRRADILTVFRNLQEASRASHLPAFQRCVERGGGARRRWGQRSRA